MKKFSYPKSLLAPVQKQGAMFIQVSDKSIPYSKVKPMFAFLGFKLSDVAAVYGVNESTVSRWQNSGNVKLDPLKSKLSYDIDSVLKLGMEVFESKKELQKWLDQENSALGGIKPSELLKDPYRIDQVEDALHAISWGNYI